ncbi:hypothetical protein RND71_042971 [Anisodus tanguticus]|uniref:Uncharacterized protein n=1 Tax=Anisodus tanguticus TaxID=243964 RepID=A0AAE1UV96_9SOLA|nr:hypothetical protein RND71_042971 [Anisodus tanguticus]
MCIIAKPSACFKRVDEEHYMVYPNNERDKRAQERYQKLNEELAKAQADKCKLTFEIYKRIEELKKEKSEAEGRVKAWEQELEQLGDRMSRRKEKMAEKRNVDISVDKEIPEILEVETSIGLEVNNQASGGDKETETRESLGSEVNRNSKNLDSTKEKQFSPGTRWSCDSTGIGTGQSEKEAIWTLTKKSSFHLGLTLVVNQLEIDVVNQEVKVLHFYGSLTSNEYQQILERLKHTQSAEDADVGTSSQSLVNEVDVWLNVVGGKKRGRAYGLSAQSSVFDQS